MRETLLHVSEPLTAARRQTLCGTLTEHGAGCESHSHSSKPQFVFITFDEERTTPRLLIEALAKKGLTARLVDV